MIAKNINQTSDDGLDSFVILRWSHKLQISVDEVDSWRGDISSCLQNVLIVCPGSVLSQDDELVIFVCTEFFGEERHGFIFIDKSVSLDRLRACLSGRRDACECQFVERHIEASWWLPSSFFLLRRASFDWLHQNTSRTASTSFSSSTP